MTVKEWHLKNKDRVIEIKRAYVARNPEKVAESKRKWVKANKHKILAKTIRYQASKRNQVPKWLTKDEIKKIEQFYINCPQGYEVDHIIPLRGKNVSGLHVIWNLQYLTRSENRKKSNKTTI